MRRPTILVVDDEDAILRLLKRVLAEADFDTRTAQNGREAVDAFRAGGVAFALLDVQMPARWDGPAVLRALQGIDPAVRAAFMTGSPGHYSAKEFSALGTLRVFEKPFACFTELTESLREMIAREPFIRG